MNMTYRMTEENLMHLADNMAAAATSFGTGGYDFFLQTREDFKKQLHAAFEEKSAPINRPIQ